MSGNPDVSDTIVRGLAFLAKRQEADGSFVSYSSASVQPFRRRRTWQTVFVPALMLTALAQVNDTPALAIRNKLAGFLLDQKGPEGAFNYWAKSAPEQKTMPYPNDLDDTFCALAGLYLHDAAVVDEKMLAQAVTLLLATETAVGGPYRTWLVPAASDPVWLDVDLAVNSNVAYFLSLIGNRLPKLDDLMDKAITTNAYSSPYYPSQYAFMYYLARAYEGVHRQELLEQVSRAHTTAASALDKALCLSARLRLGEESDLSAEVYDICSAQRQDGSWPAAMFYADPVEKGKSYYNGAPALTTTFAIEALGLYRQRNARKHRIGSLSTTNNIDSRDVYSRVMKTAREECEELGIEVRSSMLHVIDSVADSENGPEIINLAAHFHATLLRPAPPPEDFLEKLGLANLYGWAAYTVYDDLLDEEGKLALLPAANTAMRRSLACFSASLRDDKDFRACVRSTFDTIDNANAWEVAHCRFTVRRGHIMVGAYPDYGDRAILADRSLGHALPVIAVLAHNGLPPDSKASQHILRALRHYLIARQLHDDAHDWPEDLQNGHITAVVSQLLTDMAIGPGGYPIADLLPPLRRQFWQASLPGVCRQIRRHIRLSRLQLQQSGLLQPENAVTGLLDRLEAATQDALAQRAQARNFLQQYAASDSREQSS